ncbi:mitochondrial fission factor isoform X4 [Varanus komodoensis]|uniref:mitochondrial fission factor isoform X4 n=1 Tax=Varanus komodoensis TaxID=61221 RepID=UPI001CF79D5E|nr:mitochondrial fission factor isoform X4 [Varanus komodoensis]
MSKRTSSDIPLGRMSSAAFPSPAAEMAEMNRIQYEIEYTEGINQRMRVPEKLKVAPPNADLEQTAPEGGLPNASVTMQVPERIVVAGNSEDIPLSRPPDLDLLQSTPFNPLSLKTPPRVISLSERPLDFLDLERATPQTEEVRSVGRLRRERSVSENATRQNGQLIKNDSIATPSPQQVRVCPPQMFTEDGANLYSARGILSLIQSSTRRAYQQVLDVLDENCRFSYSKPLQDCSCPSPGVNPRSSQCSTFLKIAPPRKIQKRFATWVIQNIVLADQIIGFEFW